MPDPVPVIIPLFVRFPENQVEYSSDQSYFGSKFSSFCYLMFGTFPNNLPLYGEENSAAIVVPEATFKLALKAEPVLGLMLTVPVLTVPEFAIVPPESTSIVPEVNVSIKVFAENVPPLLIVSLLLIEKCYIV